MKKYCPVILCIFLCIICFGFILGCFIKSRILEYYDILIICLFILTAIITAKTKKRKHITKLIILIIINISLLLNIVIFTIFTNRELHIQNDVDAVNSFEHISLDKYSDFNTFNPFQNIKNDFESAISYDYRYYSLWEDRSKILVLKYSDNVFYDKKEYINNSYVFYDKPIHDGGPVPFFHYKDFDFRILDISQFISQNQIAQYFDTYPKYIYLIGINEYTNEIVYIIFNNDELDIISDYSEFLLNDCGWKYFEYSQNNIIFNIFYKDS